MDLFDDSFSWDDKFGEEEKEEENGVVVRVPPGIQNDQTESNADRSHRNKKTNESHTSRRRGSNRRETVQRIVIDYEEECDRHCEKMRDILKNANFSDVTFVVKGKNEPTKKIRAHKAILSGQLEYFDRMFRGGFKEGKSETKGKGDEIIIQGTEPSAFERLLCYLYSGSEPTLEVKPPFGIDISKQIIEGIVTAKMYGTDDWLEELCLQLRLAIGIGNIETFLEFCMDNGNETVEEALAEHISAGYNEYEEKLMKFVGLPKDPINHEWTERFILRICRTMADMHRS